MPGVRKQRRRKPLLTQAQLLQVMLLNAISLAGVIDRRAFLDRVQAELWQQRFSFHNARRAIGRALDADGSKAVAR